MPPLVGAGSVKGCNDAANIPTVIPATLEAAREG